MSIDASTAASIARELGLNLSDAAALAAMADDEDHARQIGQMFSPASTEDALATALRTKVPPRPGLDDDEPTGVPSQPVRSGSAPALPLNGDPLLDSLKQKLGLPRSTR